MRSLENLYGGTALQQAVFNIVQSFPEPYALKEFATHLLGLPALATEPGITLLLPFIAEARGLAMDVGLLRPHPDVGRPHLRDPVHGLQPKRHQEVERHASSVQHHLCRPISAQSSSHGPANDERHWLEGCPIPRYRQVRAFAKFCIIYTHH